MIVLYPGSMCRVNEMQKQHSTRFWTTVTITSGRASAGDDVLVTWCPVVTSVIAVSCALQK